MRYFFKFCKATSCGGTASMAPKNNFKLIFKYYFDSFVLYLNVFDYKLKDS